MKRISLLLGLVLVACHTPDLDELAKTEIRILRAPASATKVRVLANGVVREAALADRAATLLFPALPAGDSPRATAVDADGKDLETLTDGRTERGSRVVITFDFRPCEADERFAKACTAGLGLCAAPGHWACTADHATVACDAQPLPAGTEICNGHDDDCDGKTDEAEDLEPPACELGGGVCAHGKRTCLGAGGWSACDYGPDYQAAETSCDGKDNDCDGQTDPMIGTTAAACGGCNAPCTGDETCVAGRCYDAPALVFSSVRDEDWGIARDAAITLRFSRAMDQASVRAAITFTPAASFTTEWNAAGTEVVLHPAPTLAASTRYHLALATTAHDLRGKALADGLFAYFATAPTPGLFVFGGSIDDPPYSKRDAWMLVLVPDAQPRWYELDDSFDGPSPRAGALVAEDARHQRMLIAGGTPVLASSVSEVWAYSAEGGAAHWTRLVDDVPGTGFYGAGGGVDVTRDELVVYGGTRAGSCLTTPLRLSLSAPAGWQSLAMTGTVPGLMEAITAWVPQTRTLWITQGYGDRTAAGCWQPPANAPLSSPKTYTLTVGASGFTAATSPYDIGYARGLASAAWDGSQLVVYGGDGSSHADEGWSLDGSGWHLLSLSGSGPGAMRAGGMMFDPVSQRFIAFGGDSPNTAQNRNGVYALTVAGRSGLWTTLSPRGIPPEPRSGFASTGVNDAGPFVPVH